jgi:50S ribosomal protein L16 3-hydroxylase
MKRSNARSRAPAIEVRATASLPLGMTPARFLRDYWQKRPLLIRGAFPHFHKSISPEDLAGLACEEAALSRIVLHHAKRDRWTLRHGPFAESDFAKLPKTHWTLLVQDVDKWDMDVATLLDHFEFIPSWRVDDVMISYATDGGGVGPHVDNYDVFLVQGLGQRRWRISDDPCAPKEFRANADLKLLREFVPTHDWILNSGDALYLPPGVPHDGVAVAACMTFSVGMRAPSQAELLLDFAESAAESLGEENRYSDPQLRPASDCGEIDDAALARVRAAMPQFSHLDRARLAQWFGSFITRYRAAHEAVPSARPLSAVQVATKLPGARLLRNPWSRFAWATHERQARLFVAGHSYACPKALARMLCAGRDFEGAAVAQLGSSPAVWETLTALINAGHLQLSKRK